MLGTAALSTIGFLNNCRQEQKRPNILFIICDDLNDAITGMGGHPQAKTPNIDKLMQRSVQFTHGYSNNPICAPARASMLTGLYPHTTGYFGFNQQKNHWRDNPIMKEAKTVMEHFMDNGYNVYGTGKVFHNGHEDWDVWKRDDGFNGFGIKPDHGPWPWDGKHYAWWDENYRKPMPHPDMPQELQKSPYQGFGPLSKIPKYESKPEKNISGYKGWSLGGPFKYNGPNDRDLMPDEKNAKWTSDILSQQHAKPFLMMVGINRPHTPLYAPQKYFNMFPLDSVELAKILENDLEDCADILADEQDFGCNGAGLRKYKAVLEGGGKKMLKKWTQAYLACVAFVDDQIGKILTALDQSEYSEDTIVIFTSDHGYHMGEKKQLFKDSPWEESCRIPFIIDVPWYKSKGICSHPVSMIDLYPTMIDFCNLPENPNQQTNGYQLDGYSLKPFLKDPSTKDWEGPDFALSEVKGKRKDGKFNPASPETQHYSIRTEKYRYVYCYNGEEELYDHEEDPYEWHNLADQDQYKQLKTKLKEKLFDFLDWE